MKILVVDDHVLIRQATHGMLRKIRRDAVVLEAPTADEALRTLSAETESGWFYSISRFPTAMASLFLPKCGENFPPSGW